MAILAAVFFASGAVVGAVAVIGAIAVGMLNHLLASPDTSGDRAQQRAQKRGERRAGRRHPQ